MKIIAILALAIAFLATLVFALALVNQTDHAAIALLVALVGYAVAFLLRRA